MPRVTRKNNGERGRSGRSQRIEARRSGNDSPNPVPPGQKGGLFKPLSETELESIYRCALKILAEIGIGDVPPRLASLATEKGLVLTDEGRVLYPQSFVEEIIAGAAKSFTLYGRDEEHDIEVGGDKVYFGTGGAAVRTLDRDSQTYRPSTLRDLYDFTRLIDKLENISWFTRCCVATDLDDNFDLDINTAFALLKGTQKPIGTSFTIADYVAPVIEMFDMVVGGAGQFARRPFCQVHISPLISPLRYGQDAVDVAEAAIQHNMPINSIIAAQSGATAPATLAGMLAQSTAETLAGLIMVNLFKPGHPTIFSNWPFVIDLRTGAFSGSGGEIALMNAGAAQIGNYLGLVTGVSSSMADAKAVDAQMGMEKALTATAAGLSGGNLVYESSGMMASLLGASFEAFVLDNEMLSHVYRLLRGIEVNDETLGFETIRDVVHGTGHFLGTDQTMRAMQRDYYYPALSDRQDPRAWEEAGAKDQMMRAKEKVDELLEGEVSYVDPDVEAKIRAKWKIYL